MTFSLYKYPIVQRHAQCLTVCRSGVQAVEDMCLHKMADRLYAGLQQVILSLPVSRIPQDPGVRLMHGTLHEAESVSLTFTA